MVGGAVVGGAVVGGGVGWVVAGRVVAGRVVAGFLVVVVTRPAAVVVVTARPPEMPRKAPVAGLPARATVVVGRLGPVVEGVREEAGATVGSGANTVPKASQPGPQRPPQERVPRDENRGTRDPDGPAPPRASPAA